MKVEFELLMVNPFQTPQEQETATAELSAERWSTTKCWMLALCAFLLLGPTHYYFQESVFGVLLGVEETLLWPELIGALVALIAVTFRSPNSHDNLVRVAMVLIATAAILNLKFWTIDHFVSWYSGVELDRFLMSRRVFGNYAWFFWMKHVATGLVPLLFCFPQIRRRSWLSIPMLLAVFIVSAFLLRMAYLFRSDSDIVPSSYRMFFWPF